MKWPLTIALAALFPFVSPDEKREPLDGPVVGQPAPTFKLNDHTGRGTAVGPTQDGAWTVLAFYPKAATPG